MTLRQSKIGAKSFGAKSFGAKSLLSFREHQCLLWIARGKTYSEIAQIIGLSNGTITTYLNNVRRKLRAANLAQAVGIAVATGLLKYEDLNIEPDWISIWSEVHLHEISPKG